MRRRCMQSGYASYGTQSVPRSAVPPEQAGPTGPAHRPKATQYFRHTLHSALSRTKAHRLARVNTAVYRSLSLTFSAVAIR